MPVANRLGKLQVNFKQWLSENLSRSSLINRWENHCDKIVENMLRAFARKECGFYDSYIQHGGPDPNPELRPDGKPRKSSRKRRDIEQDEEDLNPRYDSSNPAKGLKQITDGFRSWTSRHINECHGQRKGDYINKRMNNWVRKVPK
jgi:hypothetical protein